MTPTLCTGSSTAKLCHSRSYQPAAPDLFGDDRVRHPQQVEPLRA